MCTAELIGDYYRGCQHFVGLYYTGERTDCNSPKCGVSAAHRHTAPNCPCPKVRLATINTVFVRADVSNAFVARPGRAQSTEYVPSVLRCV
ncbi:hypothetical protein PLEOSDRAFT_34021 [Pleurotus ostreatus PC15]|uniref:Uncharacterized protein n=1 Tax=Pleurotus ostreatus (strain PC15) TaxID=1137138 RepID=A0A067NM50_PLEO1|nr:hypothetical protein PLEOSDRAFT_34021 [Pleurotus ostreatus PC15]